MFWKWHLGADTFVTKFDEGRMSKAEKFTFFVIFVFLVLIYYETIPFLALVVPAEATAPNVWDIVSEFIYITSTLGGLFYLYTRHTESTSFVEKSIIVGIVTIPFVMLCIEIPLIFVVIPLEAIIFPEQFEHATSTWIIALFTLMSEFLIYAKLGTYFK